MDPANYDELMVRYIQDTCTPEEKNLFEDWLQQSEENRQQYFDTHMLWHASRIEYYRSEEQLNKALTTFTINIQHSPQQQRRKIYRLVFRYAAIFIGVLALTWIFLVYNGPSGNSQQLLTASVSYTDSSKLVVLGDGTQVWLNNNSSITYPRKFEGAERRITLSGEAYFKVTHDPAHPFIIHTSDIRIKVLGTEFNVYAYPGVDQTETVLVNGEIAIDDSLGNELTVMRPGQLATFVKSIHKLSIRNVDTVAYASWRYGQIVLKSAHLKTIFRKLSELYQVDISTGASLSDTAIYDFTFSKTKPVKEVLEMISFIAPVTWRMEGRTIQIIRK